MGIKALYHENYGYPVANRPANDYGYSIIPLNFYCDGNSIKIEGETSTYFNITANFFAAEIYEFLNNEEAIEYLTRIKGVGRWTAEMILMFTLGREDVFPVDDLGIQQAITKLYKLDAADKKLMKEKMLLISSKWSPYRTYACMYLWGWKDNTPISNKQIVKKK